MPSLTDGAIRRALKEVAETQKPMALADGEGRGTGRMILVIRPMPTRVTADWMAQQWRAGARTRKKFGAYPAMSLADARLVYDRDYSQGIQKGRSIKMLGDTRAGTVGDLFSGYVASLKAAGKPSWVEVEHGLGKIAGILGRHRAARDIEPEEVVSAIRPIFERGCRSMADHTRSYVRAAYSWGLKSEHDYRTRTPRRFGLLHNPAAGIPSEPYVPQSRWLSEAEFRQLYRWLECPDTPVHPPYTRAVRLLMLTGQRVEEIASLHVSQWDGREKIIDWSTTKNGKAHAIPVPQIGADLMSAITPNEYGWFFPSAMDPMRPVSHSTLYAFIWRQRGRGVIPMANNRDLRRTWKTLAGKAGLSKEIRDRIQNHTLQDISSKAYDRWNYMPEKRAAMKKWNAFILGVLGQTRGKAAA
ncbi:tyrosine-type recombinase/integrase [Caulobacter sp. 602-2]|uniref:Tyrosine-type recombinase/integrase n=1 Tax=Caulobacter sp. 602-2 TaxID=2710887 RepID=A0A6G4QVB9_9CAUL|nr:site-specific integrase [Caulobacter sp. 602-2]NGM49389.1 tyrosine-type recombinase/integrase [Caulobacter sp. 602-2]